MIFINVAKVTMSKDSTVAFKNLKHLVGNELAISILANIGLESISLFL